MNPGFGTNLRRFLFSGITETNIEELKVSLINSLAVYIPEVTVQNITVTPNADYNLISISVDYILNISNTPDQVTVQFQ
jgi:phage baseplate assembly protein W